MALAWSLGFENFDPASTLYGVVWLLPWLREVAGTLSGVCLILFGVQNHSRTILSIVLHVCTFTSIVFACGYTAIAMALPFTWGAMAGAMFYLVLLLIIWD